MTSLNQRDSKTLVRVYLETSLNLIELFVNDIVEIHHLPNFEASSVEEQADIHGVVIVKEDTNLHKIFESLSNIYVDVELRLDEPSKMLTKFTESSIAVELLLVEHSDYHRDV